jgi:chemotaxis protein CheD
MYSFAPLKIFLAPGDYYFGNRNTRISTVLGSCVSITLWHPKLLVGGMCHYMLPKRGIDQRIDDLPVPNGRYADEAIALLLKKIDAIGAPYKEYQVKLFGGGNMFPGSVENRMPHIGFQNVQAAKQLVNQHGFTCVAEHMGGIGYRNVIFKVWSGEVWIKYSNVSPLFECEPKNRNQG